MAFKIAQSVNRGLSSVPKWKSVTFEDGDRNAVIAMFDARAL